MSREAPISLASPGHLPAHSRALPCPSPRVAGLRQSGHPQHPQRRVEGAPLGLAPAVAKQRSRQGRSRV